jgi:GT2 family glycosyltransferase
MKPLILVGCPIQNREDVVERYLESIYNLDYPKDRIILSFYVNNSTDRTGELINRFTDLHGYRYHGVYYFEDKKIFKGRTDDQSRRKRDYVLFTIVRNNWLTYIEPIQFDYLMSIDSDVLIEPQGLNKLIENIEGNDSVDVCSALVFNGKFLGKMWYNYLSKTKPNFLRNNVPDKLFEVSVTGACILIPKELLQFTRYDTHKQGEDVPFCRNLVQQDFRLWCDPTIKTEHLLSGDKRGVRNAKR